MAMGCKQQAPHNCSVVQASSDTHDNIPESLDAMSNFTPMNSSWVLVSFANVLDLCGQLTAAKIPTTPQYHEYSATSQQTWTAHHRRLVYKQSNQCHAGLFNSTNTAYLFIKREKIIAQEFHGAAAGASGSAAPVATSPREHSFHRSPTQASEQAVSCDAKADQEQHEKLFCRLMFTSRSWFMTCMVVWTSLSGGSWIVPHPPEAY